MRNEHCYAALAVGMKFYKCLYPKSDGTAVGNLANTNNKSKFPAQLNKL